MGEDVLQCYYVQHVKIHSKLYVQMSSSDEDLQLRSGTSQQKGKKMRKGLLTHSLSP